MDQLIYHYTDFSSLLGIIESDPTNLTFWGSKPCKRWVLYSDELDKFLEVNRRNSVPMTAEEQNEVILASHRRKPVKPDWRKEHECQTPKKEPV